MDNNRDIQKGIAPIIILCIVMVLIVIGAGAWIWIASQKNLNSKSGEGKESVSKPRSEPTANQNAIGQPGNMQESIYPDDYTLKASEIPAGF